MWLSQQTVMQSIVPMRRSHSEASYRLFMFGTRCGYLPALCRRGPALTRARIILDQRNITLNYICQLLI